MPDIHTIAIDEVTKSIQDIVDIPAEKVSELRVYIAHQADNLAAVKPLNFERSSRAMALLIALKAANIAVDAGDELDAASQKIMIEGIRTGIAILARVVA